MKIKLAFISAASLLVCSCWNNAETTVPLVQMFDVSTDTGEVQAVYPGRSVADQNSSLAFRVSGTIDKVLVKPGDDIKKGQAVATLDKRDYRTQLNATEAEYKQIKAEVERVMAMYEDDAVTANDYDKARYGLTQIEQKLAHHRSQLEDCTLKSPYDACVEDINFQSGETVMAGIPVLSLFGQGQSEIVVNLSASDYLRRDQIESVVATFTVLPGKEFPLAIKGISHKANANQLYEMRLTMNTSDKDITPGMTAMVRVNFKKQESGSELAIPANALFKKADMSLVYCFDDSTSCIHTSPVEILKILSNGMTVVSGLEEGDVIVSAGVDKLTNGQKVRRVQKVSDTNPGGLL